MNEPDLKCGVYLGRSFREPEDSYVVDGQRLVEVEYHIVPEYHSEDGELYSS